MASKRDEEITQVFQNLWKEHGHDVSTEFLISKTADVCQCSYSRVVSALGATSKSESSDKD